MQALTDPASINPAGITAGTGGLQRLARLFLGGVFLYACADKILHPSEFARAVYNYQILPDQLVNLTALILPWLELVLGLCLIAGFWLPGAVFWSNGLLWAFFVALVFNTARGLDVHCGCFSSKPDPAGSAPAAWYLARDSFFLLCAGYLLVTVFARPKQELEAQAPARDVTGDKS
jgi:uncharacterized membrane protein YphA (DoxX/SURF4 family)